MLPFTLLLITIPGLRLASGVFIDFRLTTSNPNHLTLECFDSGTGDVDLDAAIYFFSSPSTSPSGSILSGETSDVTPANEALLRCTSSDDRDHSDFVAIAGKWFIVLQWLTLPLFV